MDAGDAAQDRFLLAVCPQCSEPLYPPREYAGKKVRCPSCGGPVLVPHEEPLPEPVGDEYVVADEDYRARRITYLKQPCPTCGTLLYAEPSRIGTTMVCPDCGVNVLVRPQELPKRRERTPDEIGEYRVGGFEQPAAARNADHFLVACPTCNARLHPSRKLVGKRVKCPDCGKPLVVPAPPEKTTKAVEPPKSVYGLESPETVRRDINDYIPFACPKCGTKMTAAREHAGKRMRCPDCRRPTVIPGADPRVTRHVAEFAKDYSPANDFVPPPDLKAPVEPDAIEHRIPQAETPRWTFVSGVFTFPWRGEALWRWGMVTLGLSVSSLIVTAGLLIADVAGGGMNLIAGVSLAFFAMMAFWTALWTYSFAAGCMLAIMQDTSSGSQEVLSWPEGDWREWFWPMLHVGYVLFAAVAAGYLIAWLTSPLADSPSAVGVVVVFVLFPIFLVSSLEGDSALILLTRPVLRSLVTLWWGWLLVLAMAAMLIIALLFIARFFAFISWFAVPVGSSPAIAAALFIYARLLGRLAWRVTT